jgi:tRNA(fMet)-specific endonuclease VapC
MILADTDVLIDFLRGSGLAGRVELEFRNRALETTVITAFELQAGAHSERQQKAVGAILTAMKVHPLTSAAANRAGLLRRQLREAGQELPMADYLIAGICLEVGGILLTRNHKHFERVPDLKLGGTA